MHFKKNLELTKVSSFFFRCFSIKYYLDLKKSNLKKCGNKMKKLKIFIIALLAMISLVGCSSQNSTVTEDDLNNVISKLEIAELDKPIAVDSISLPKNIKGNGKTYNISYYSNTDFFKIKGGLKPIAEITRPESIDASGVLTATIQANSLKASKNFDFTILAKSADGNSLIDEFGLYDDKDNVSLYIVTYKKLPSNYYDRDKFNSIKNKWTPENKYACFGGRHGNKEGHLPKNDSYYECDVDYGPKGPKNGRGAKRLVFSLETLNVYYTSNHYNSFTQLYDHGVKCY